ncbi:MAG: hypothetical protein WDZ59_05045 [Pirellulales bacterium]
MSTQTQSTKTPSTKISSTALPADQQSKPQGRPEVLDQAKRGTVCALVAIGCSRSQAAEYVGCSPSTITRLAQRNEPFAEQLRQAEMQREVTPLKNVVAASGRSWRAGAWLLERMYPDRYGRRQPDAVSRGEVIHFAEQMGRIIRSHIHDPFGLQQVEGQMKRLIEEIMGEYRSSSPHEAGPS